MNSAATPWLRRDVSVMLIGLLLLLAWDASGWDLAVMKAIADGHSFPWRSHWLTGLVLHQGGRWLSWGVVAAFGFFGMYFLWRDHDDKFARGWLMGVLIVGLLFALTQTVRGAHYPSHSAWTAWLSWTVFSALSAVTLLGDGRKNLAST